MSIHYLQKKIPPVANNYIIVGTNGQLTTSSQVPAGMLPQITINISIPSGTTMTSLQAQCMNVFTPIVETSGVYKCKVPQFGYWKVSGIYNDGEHDGVVVSDVVLVQEITTYSCTLSVS